MDGKAFNAVQEWHKCFAESRVAADALCGIPYGHLALDLPTVR